MQAMLVFMSSSFIEDEQTSGVFLYGMQSLHRPFLLAATGHDFDWTASEIGMLIGPEKVFSIRFINMNKLAYQYKYHVTTWYFPGV